MPQLEQIHTFLGQIFWLVLTFGFLYVVLWKSALPRMSAILLERQERVDEDLRKAETFKQEAEEAMAAYEKTVADASSEAQAVLRAENEKLAANAATRQEALTAKIKQDTAEAEERIGKARAQAVENIHTVAVEVAQAATSRLIGADVPADEARSAVDAALQGRG